MQLPKDWSAYLRRWNNRPLRAKGIAAGTFCVFGVLLLLHLAAGSSWRLLLPDESQTLDLPGLTPQLYSQSQWEDRLLNLNASDPIGWPPERTPSVLEDLKYAVLLPTFRNHFSNAAAFFRSVKCLCLDHARVDFYVIVSDSVEQTEFQAILDAMEPCGTTFGRWDVPWGNVNGSNVKVNVINLFDILPVHFLGKNIRADSTTAILKARGKYFYQGLKKFASAIHFEFDYALWLDSEAIAVRPFRLRETFETYVQAPTIFRSRTGINKFIQRQARNAARVLGRSLDSFGPLYRNLESVNWIVEKEVLLDMVRYVEAAHGRDFWAVWSDNDGPFEICVYNMHIAARKLETVNSMFSKYAVLEVEREMIRFGMASAFPYLRTNPSAGFLEMGWNLLRAPGIQSNFSSFLGTYGQRLFRFEDLSVAPAEVVERFLLTTPLDLLVCGAPDLHSWWSKMISSTRSIV